MRRIPSSFLAIALITLGLVAVGPPASAQPAVQNGNAAASYTAIESPGQTISYLPYVAKGTAGSPTSHIFVANLAGAQQTITVSFYENTATPVHQEMKSVPADSPWHLELSELTGLPLGFSGSAVVSGSAALGAVASLGDGGFADLYTGMAEGSSLRSVPFLYNGFFGRQSLLVIQNMGSATASVTVTYSDAVTSNETLPAKTSVRLDQSSEGHVPGAVFSAQITSDQPVVALVQTRAGDDSEAIEFPFTGGNAFVVMPFAPKGYQGWSSLAAICLNLSTSTIPVTITYEGYPADALDLNVPPGETCSSISALESVLPSGYRGFVSFLAGRDSLEVTGSLTRAAGDGDALCGYAAPRPPSTGPPWVLHFPFAGVRGQTGTDVEWNTTLELVNLSTNPNDLSLRFYRADGSTVSAFRVLDAEASEEIPLANLPLPDGIYALEIEALESLVGIATVAVSPRALFRDGFESTDTSAWSASTPP